MNEPNEAAIPVPREFEVTLRSPGAGKISVEWLGLADTLQRRPQNILDLMVDSLEQLAVVLHKPLLIVSGRWREGQIHSALNVRFSAWPDSASAVERRTWAAFVGLAS